MKYRIELTNDCNLKCEMCPRNYIDMEFGYISEDLWNSIIAKIPTGSTILPFWRGESTLHPDFVYRILSLEGNDVVLATNGTKPDEVIEVMDYLNVVNVSIHGQESYEGYLKIKKHANGTKVIASMVEGETKLVDPDRIYRRHTVNGIWGKVDGTSGALSIQCSNLDEKIIAWNGDNGRCVHVWDLSASHSVCDTCDQWMGNGKTL